MPRSTSLLQWEPRADAGRTDGQRFGNPQPLGGNEMPRFAGITTFALPSDPPTLMLRSLVCPSTLVRRTGPVPVSAPAGSGRSR